MARATKALTTGLKFMGGSDTQAYTLEHLTSSRKHKAGSYETIVVPYVELGRHNSCAVQFSDDVGTVSRKHAAIERKGNDVIVKNLSTTNPTLVNGRPVNKQYFLNNGDEIQLSVEGPKLRYNVSDTGTAKMGMTKRMNLVMQQAVKPYKMVAIGLVAVILLVASGGAFALVKLNEENQLLAEKVEVQQEITEQQADSLAAINQKNKKLLANVEQTKQQMAQQFARERQRIMEENKKLAEEMRKQQASTSNYAEIIEPLKGKTLAIFLEGIKITYQGQTILDKKLDPECMCTGFLIEDGTFVTARHCVDAMLTDVDVLNFYEHSGGNTTLHYSAKSYDGSISLSFTNDDMVADYTMDTKKSVTYQGQTGVIRLPDYFSGADWAYMPTDLRAGLQSDSGLSMNLKSGTELFVLGYSYGERYRKSGSMEPYFSTAKTTLSGVHDGTVNVTEAGWDGGNSGGPVFVMHEGEPKVIGLVTGTFRKQETTETGEQVMVNSSIKMVTPLGNLK